MYTKDTNRYRDVLERLDDTQNQQGKGVGMMSVVEILKSFGICFLSAIPIWLYCAFFMLLA